MTTTHPRKQARLTPKQAATLRPVCLSISKLNPTAIDSGVLEELFADITLTTLAEVAKLFGVASTTVSSNWRRDGMPGEEGRWKLIDIARWLIERNVKRLDSSTGRQSVDESRKQVELEIKRLELAKLQRDERRELGELLNRHVTLSTMRSAIAVATERIITAVDGLAVLLPVEHAVVMVERLRGDMTRHLRALAELTAEELKDADADITTRFEQVELMLSYERANHKGESPANGK